MNKLIETVGYVAVVVMWITAQEAFAWVKKRRKRRGAVNEFKKAIDIDNQINELIAYLRDRYGFSRVCVIDYHNGDISLNGFSFKNMSMRNERTDLATKSLLMEFQKVPTSLASKMLQSLEKSESGYMDVTDQGDEDVNIDLRLYGSKQTWSFRLGNSLINGCVCLVSNYKAVSLTHDEILDIKAVCHKIYLLRTKK